MHYVKVVQTNKHQVFGRGGGGGGGGGGSSSSSSSSSCSSSCSSSGGGGGASNIFYRTTTAVTKIPTHFQNCITEEVPYVTPICNSARLPATKWKNRNHLFLLCLR